jgi:hypothetical protein
MGDALHCAAQYADGGWGDDDTSGAGDAGRQRGDSGARQRRLAAVANLIAEGHGSQEIAGQLTSARDQVGLVAP